MKILTRKKLNYFKTEAFKEVCLYTNKVKEDGVIITLHICPVCHRRYEYYYGEYFTPFLFWYRQCDSLNFCSKLCKWKYFLFYKHEHLDREHYGNQTTIRRGIKNWFKHKILKRPLSNCRN